MLFVTRDQWGAAAPTGPYDRWLPGKPVGSVVHWEGPRMGTWAHDACAAKVKGTQRYHQSKGYYDIAYNAVACPHGFVFEGQPIAYASDANGPRFNGTHTSICFLGGEGDGEPELAKNAIREWTDQFGADKRAHRDVNSTACPGDGWSEWVHAGMPGGPAKPGVDWLKFFRWVADLLAHVERTQRDAADHDEEEES